MAAMSETQAAFLTTALGVDLSWVVMAEVVFVDSGLDVARETELCGVDRS